jgi:hypothetical protein
MQRARRVLRGSVVGVVVAVVATAGLVPGVPVGPAAAAPPTLTIDPASDLVDGQRVTVGGSGYPADDFPLLAQCPSDFTSVFDGSCRFAGGSTDANGDLSGQLVVRAILDPDADPVIDCRVPDACVLIAATYDDELGDYRELARAVLPFTPDGPLAPPPTLSVTPDEGLVDGQTVEVSGSGVLSEGVELIQCTPGPANRGDCDDETSSFYSAPGGSFTESHQVFAVIATPNGGRVDCRTAGRCVLAVLAEDGRWADTTSVPLGFAPDGPLQPPPTLTITPAEGLVDGQTVEIVGAGFRRGFGVVQIYECAPDPAPDRCRTVSDDFIFLDEQGGFTASAPVSTRAPTPGGLHDCRTGAERCSLVATTSGVDSARAGRVDLRFDPDGPLLPDPEIEVEPAGDLGDFTSVAVSGRHFTPG